MDVDGAAIRQALGHAKEFVQDLQQARDLGGTVNGFMLEHLVIEIEGALAALRSMEQTFLDAQKLANVVAGHLADERKRHRRTQQVLARMLGVEPDTEAYDEVFDRAVAEMQQEVGQ
jgi:hypothetical protein